MTTINPQFAFIVRYVTDLEAATRFYVDVLGLTVQRSHPTFVQFENFALASDEPLAGSGEPEIYWQVEDAEGALAAMSEQGEVSLPLTEMPFGKVFGMNDQDGQPCYFIEFAMERPSTAV